MTNPELEKLIFSGSPELDKVFDDHDFWDMDDLREAIESAMQAAYRLGCKEMRDRVKKVVAFVPASGHLHPVIFSRKINEVRDVLDQAFEDLVKEKDD